MEKNIFCRSFKNISKSKKGLSEIEDKIKNLKSKTVIIIFIITFIAGVIIGNIIRLI